MLGVLAAVTARVLLVTGVLNLAAMAVGAGLPPAMLLGVLPGALATHAALHLAGLTGSEATRLGGAVLGMIVMVTSIKLQGFDAPLLQLGLSLAAVLYTACLVAWLLRRRAWSGGALAG